MLWKHCPSLTLWDELGWFLVYDSWYMHMQYSDLWIKQEWTSWRGKKVFLTAFLWKGSQSDNVMLIWGLCHEGFLDETNEVFKEMESNGYGGWCYVQWLVAIFTIRNTMKHTHQWDVIHTRAFSADAFTASLILNLLRSEEKDMLFLLCIRSFSKVITHKDC